MRDEGSERQGSSGSPISPATAATAEPAPQPPLRLARFRLAAIGSVLSEADSLISFSITGFLPGDLRFYRCLFS
jgi:hypothetical protein